LDLAFKSRNAQSAVLTDPVKLFRSLPLRKIETENPHQQQTLLHYASNLTKDKDIAIQLPTGSGKTLVGLMISEWRRKNFSERIVYLCPTKQLVYQTVSQANDVYGLDVKGFVGSHHGFNQADVSSYRNGGCIAVATYSAIFNSNPFFDDAHVLVLDDAHTVENYIAKNWSLELLATVEEQRGIFGLLAKVFGTQISRYGFAMLENEVKPEISRGWMTLLPIDKVLKIQDEVAEILDEHAYDANVHFVWKLLRSHLSGCNFFLAPGQILIRPYIPPTWSSSAFNNPKQRIYLSATLGEGGDLERLTGRRSIKRLKAPAGLEAHGVGRRFFIFPTSSLDDDDASNLISKLLEATPRAVFLTTSGVRADNITRWITEKVGYSVFSSDDIERSKATFISTDQAVAVLAGRFDGMDFPKDESRLLLIDDVPSMVNLQEQFIAKQLGATALLRDRVKTRVLQAIGRCTRSFVDTSAVVVTGSKLRDYLLDVDLTKELHPELQAEIDFGAFQSADTPSEELLKNFASFLALDKEWQSANSEIANQAAEMTQVLPSYLPQLQDCVRHEILFAEAMWREDYAEAYDQAVQVLDLLTDPNLRGLRSFWSYQAGAAALLESKLSPRYIQLAKDQFSRASKASDISWLSSLRRLSDDTDTDTDAARQNNQDDNFQVGQVAKNFSDFGVTNNRKFNKEILSIQVGFDDLNSFEDSQVALGKLLGFTSDNSSATAAPDPWWTARAFGIVFEDYAGGKEISTFSPTKAKQAMGHVKWLKYNRPECADINFTTIIVTPTNKIYHGALPQITDSLVWPLKDYIAWANNALSVLRKLKTSFRSEEDLVWRAECLTELEAKGLTMSGILAHVRKVDISSTMEVVGDE
jgi:hypothetical protein